MPAAAGTDDDDGSDTGSDSDTDGDSTDDTGDQDTSADPDLPPESPPESPQDPDAAEKLFSHEYLPVYRVTMQGDDWPGAWAYLLSQLDVNDKCAERPYTATSMIFENPWSGETESYEQVGFRIRGHDLPQEILEKPDERFGFKMSFAHFDPGRRFHGHKILNFLSSEYDDTFLRQCLVYELLRDFDVPAARCNLASVYVNDDYVGVFAHVEERDDGTYTKNRFPDDPSGSLYEFGDCLGDKADVLTDLGPDLGPYLDTYQLEAGTLESDMLSDLIPFMQCVSAPEQDFIACIEDHVDLDEWHRAMAANFVIPEMDGWAPSGANFLLYHYGPNGTPRRFVVFPWDVDRAFKDDCYENDLNGGNHTGACHILGRSWEGGESPELVNRLREPPFRADFCATVQAFVDQHYNPEAMATRLHTLRTQPRQAANPFKGLAAPSLEDLIQNDPQWDLERFEDELEDLIEDKIPNRYAAMLEQLAECEMSPLIDN